MNNNQNNKRLIIFGSIIFVILIVLLFAFNNKNTKTNKNTNGIENGSNSGTNYSSINAVNANQLFSYLLASQYIVVKDAIASYVADNISVNVKNATVVSSGIKQNGDGSLTFSVTTDGPKATFVCGIAMPNPNELIFTVPIANFSKTYHPYGNSSGTNYAQ